MVILIKTNLREGKLSGGGALVIQAHPCWFGIVDHVLIIDISYIKTYMFVIMIIVSIFTIVIVMLNMITSS